MSDGGRGAAESGAAVTREIASDGIARIERESDGCTSRGSAAASDGCGCGRSAAAGEVRPPWVVRVLLTVYRGGVSPALHAMSPSRCRYLPTCSEYAYVATARFGVVRGGAMALWRLVRCHPFSKGGLDPVPSAPVKANHLA